MTRKLDILFPEAFPELAWIFALICSIAAFTRRLFGYKTVK